MANFLSDNRDLHYYFEEGADWDTLARLTELGSVVFAGSPSDFGKHLTEETEKWGKVIRAANIKPE